MADQEQQPWAERTVEVPPEPSPFRRGVASVGSGGRGQTETFPAVPHEPTGTGWPGGEPRDGVWHAGARLPMSYHLAQWRIGRHWSLLGGWFAFVCWGVWAISSWGNLTSPALAFVFTLIVAIGLFSLARLVGRVIWERQLGRTRHGARGAHLVTGLFLAGVGLAYLRQTEWVVSAWNWAVNL